MGNSESQQQNNPNQQQNNLNLQQNNAQQQQIYNQIYSQQPVFDQEEHDLQRLAYRNVGGKNQNLHFAPSIEKKNVKAVKNDIMIHQKSFKMIRDENNKRIYYLTFKMTLECEAAISIFYAARDQVQQGNPLTLNIDLANPNYLPNRCYKFQQCKDSDYPQNIYPLDLTQINAQTLCNYQKDYYSLLVKVEKIDRSVEYKVMYSYLQFKFGKNGEIEPICVKQKLELNGQAYILNEVYGLMESEKQGKECVICYCEKANTIITPCKHMCTCFECCQDLRSKTNICPLCRTKIESYVMIDTQQK